MERPFQGERREVQAPPLCEFRLTGGVWLVGLTAVFAPVNYWRKGLLRFWLTAGFIPRVFCSWLTDFQLKFLHYHQSCEVETASVVRYLLPHWIDSKFADGSKTKLDVRSTSAEKQTTIRG